MKKFRHLASRAEGTYLSVDSIPISMNKNLFLSLIYLIVLTGPALAQDAADQAAARQKFHAFDFWIGEWDVDRTMRQVWEQSSDKGERWQVVFDGMYKRK